MIVYPKLNVTNNNEFIVSYFLGAKENLLQDQNGNTFLRKIKANNQEELNSLLENIFFASLKLGVFDTYFSTFAVDKNKLKFKRTSFIMGRSTEPKEKNILFDTLESIFSE